MGVEENRREGGVRAWPCEKEKRFVLVGSKVKGLGLERGDGLGEVGEETDGGSVVWGGVSGAYAEVLLETSDGGRWILRMVLCGYEEGDEEN